MAATDAKPFPFKNQAYRVTFPIMDADGDLVTAATALDSEVSKDGATFTDCTSEATEIATGSGMYFLDLTAAEMNADTVAVIVKTTTSGAKTTAMVLYPLESGDIIANVTQWAGSATTTANIALKNTLAKTTDVTGFNDLSAAQVNTEADTALADVGLTTTVTGRIDAAVSTRATPAQVQTELGSYGGLKPTTAGRTLDVSATGEAGIDWANIGSPSTAQNLSSTNIKTDQIVGSVTAPVALTSAYDAAKTAAAPGAAMTLTSGERVNIGIAVRDTSNASPAVGSVGAEIKAGVATDPWTTILPGSYAANSAGSLIGNNLDAKVSTRLPTSSYTSPPSSNENAVATRDINNTNPAANSLGAAINSAAAAGDPWATAIPGSYGVGTAGKILGDNIDAKISTRMSQASYVTPPTAAQNAAAVRDVSNASPVAGSLGADVKAGGTDPWGVLLPGSYGLGTAGYFIGDRLDAKTSTRMEGIDFIPPIPAATIAIAVRDVDNTSPASGSMGDKINSAASAGDPWSTLLPGAYTGGTAGKIIGDQLDAKVSTRLATASYIAPPTKEVIAVAVRDVDNTNPADGSLGDKINSAASAGDPWATVLPGSYGAGSAGKLMSDNLDAKVSTRFPTASYVTPPTVVEVANGVRDVDNRTPAVNSLGAGVNAAASAGDPWSTVLPGSYGANTAGSIIGTKIDAAVSSRLATNGYTAPPSLLATAEAVRDVDNTNPATNSLGAAVNAAASAGDPWTTQLPGTYPAGSAGKLLSDNLNAPVTSRLATSGYTVPPNVSQIATATRDVDNTNPIPGSMGDKINSAASAGDPWATFLPGSYGAGTAGDLIGNNIDVRISTRLASAGYVQAPSAQSVAESVRDVDNTAPASNSLGAAINVSALAGDPWVRVLPGGYGAGTAGKLVGDNLDAKVSTRSTYAGGDTPGTATLLTRVPSPLAINGGKVDVNDKTGFSLTPAYDGAKNAAQPGDAMSLTPTERTTLTSSVWQYLTGFMTTVGTIGRLIVDNLNAPVSSRLATASYTVPDNTGISQIKTKTDSLPSDPAGVSNVPTPAIIAAAVRDVDNATPVSGSLGADVKAGALVSDPWAVNVPGSYPPGSAGNLVGSNLDAKVGSRLATSAIMLNGGAVTVGTNNDKSGYSLVNGQITGMADEILKRDWQLVSGEATYCVLNALRFLRDAWEVQPDGTLIVYKENGQIAWTRSVKADPEAQPIVGVQ